MLIFGRKIALTDFFNFSWGIPHGKWWKKQVSRVSSKLHQNTSIELGQPFGIL